MKTRSYEYLLEKIKGVVGVGREQFNQHHPMRDVLLATYPHSILLESDYYTIDEYEDWCFDHFGPKHGECNHKACKAAATDPRCTVMMFERYFKDPDAFPVEDISYMMFSHVLYRIGLSTEDCDFILKSHCNFDDDIEKKKIVRNRLVSATEKELTSLQRFDMREDWWTVEHSHTETRWTTLWYAKTGYDYGFQEFFFRDAEDAVFFRVSNQ